MQDFLTLPVLSIVKKENFPFTYLGLPLGITKPNLEYFLSMVVRVEKRICGIADFLDYGGKLLMVKSVLFPANILHELLRYSSDHQ
jgi:hypothetical protein